MNGQLEPWAVQTAKWIQDRVRAHEAKFPAHVAHLKAAVTAARLEREAATGDEEIARAVQREDEAIYALITAFPK